MKKHQKVRRADAALVIQNRNSFRRNSPRWRKALAWAVTAWTLGMAPAVYANPILDSKDAAVAITGLGTSNVAISSSETNNLIKWVDFSIASGEKVAFDAKNYLNYVTGHARSDILGTLTGGDNIYLVNPNGILIGDGAVINVGSLHLSTRALTDAQLAAFTPNGESPLPGTIGGDVINMGNLNADIITVEGKNITFKNVADVTKDGTLGTDGKITGGTVHDSNAVTLTAGGGKIHIGSDSGGAYGSATSGTMSGYATNGTTHDYKLVSTADQLKAIFTNYRSNVSGNYMLKNNIDMSKAGTFTPIACEIFGNTSYFIGRFDGLGYKIKNITIASSDNSTFSIGLFGRNKGVIENVGLEGGTVTGRTNAACTVGSIVGNNEGTVRNVWSTATVTGTGNNSSVGGIVGYNTGTVDRAYNTGAVTGGTSGNGVANGTGGIVGQIGGGTVSQVFNTGTVTAGTSSCVGGVAGFIFNSNANANLLHDAYNKGAVSGDYAIGGVIGNLTQGTVTNVYNSGGVAGGESDYKGGIIGLRQGGTLNNGYTTAGCPAIGHGSDTGASMLQYINQETSYLGFDFSENGVWRIYEDYTMPLLTAFLTKKDIITNTTAVYNGTGEGKTGDVGARYAATEYTEAVAQIREENGKYVYGYNYVSDVSKVTPKDLTVTFGNISKPYDGTTNATAAGTATLGGKIDGDDVSLNTTNLAYAYADKNAGENKTVNYTGIALSGEKAKNYNLTATTYDNTASTISKADITVSVGDITKTYDGTTNTDNTTDATGGAFTVTSGTLYDGDTISGTKTFDTKDAGTGNKIVTLSGVTISDAAGNTNNYNISTVNNTTSTINKAPLTVEFGTTAKNYDGTTTATLPATYTLNGKVDLATENVDIIPENLSIAYADKNAGDGKIVNYSGIALTGTTAGNYALTSTTATGNGSIYKKGVYVTSFADTDKTYDGTTTATPGAATLSGIIDADLGKVGVRATAVYDGINAGPHTVTYSDVDLTGAEAGNYQLSSSHPTGAGTISRRPLWLVANPVTITEGQATPTTWGGSVTGFVAGEGLTDTNALFFALDNPAATAVGSYSVTGTLNGATSGDYGQNYTFANAAGNATAFTIEAKQVTPQEIIEEATNNQNAAREYTDVVASLESGTNTVLPTTNNMLPTDGVMPTNSVLPTGNNAPTGSPQPTEASQENNSASGEQNETQEQNGLLPTQQTDNGQISAGKQETQLGITYTDINMPESMSVEALATSLNGGSTTTTPNNAGGEATQNGPATEPTSTEPASNGGSDEEA